ncbi:MAG: ATP-binding protein [Gaiellaceae bacterium]
MTHRLLGALFSAAAVAVVTGVVFALKPVAPVLSLGVLYLFAVLPVAIAWGLAYALPVSIASLLAFNFFFLPPLHTFRLRDSENWVALAVYLVTAVVASELAARARRRTADAEQREREATLLAESAAGLLESGDVRGQLRAIAERAARALGGVRGWIELDSLRRPDPGESAHDLDAGGRHVGRLFVRPAIQPPGDVEARVLPALASLLAGARDRERLGRTAVEAETLRRSDAAKTALLRAASHDLRSPLTAIRVASEGLESASLALSADDRSELLATIRLETKRLDRLVRNLLDLSRLEVGAAEPSPVLWTADGLVARALEELGVDSERVRVSLPEDLPPVRTDPAQIERVLVNLLENALKFSPDGEEVDLHVAREDGEVVFHVADGGEGVASRDLERVFEPFETGPTPRRGTGLGLAIARGFAQANGGRVWAESPPTGGARFSLALPAEDRIEVGA